MALSVVGFELSFFFPCNNTLLFLSLPNLPLFYQSSQKLLQICSYSCLQEEIPEFECPAPVYQRFKPFFGRILFRITINEFDKLSAGTSRTIACRVKRTTLAHLLGKFCYHNNQMSQQNLVHIFQISLLPAFKYLVFVGQDSTLHLSQCSAKFSVKVGI